MLWRRWASLHDEQIIPNRVRSPYWNLPEATAASFIGDWFRTGDDAHLDDEGFLFIVDRLRS